MGLAQSFTVNKCDPKRKKKKNHIAYKRLEKNREVLRMCIEDQRLHKELRNSSQWFVFCLYAVYACRVFSFIILSVHNICLIHVIVQMHEYFL